MIAKNKYFNYFKYKIKYYIFFARIVLQLFHRLLNDGLNLILRYLRDKPEKYLNDIWKLIQTLGLQISEINFIMIIVHTFMKN